MAKLATPLDVERARSDTPGLQAGAGGTGAFLNSAGAALMPQTVLDTQLRHLQREAMIGGYGAAQEAGSGTQTTSRVGAVYRSIATLIGAAPSEIALVENATVAWQLAFYAVAAGFQPGDRILTAASEYAANYVAYLQVAKRTGCVVEVIPSDEAGETSPAALEQMIDDRVKLISITHVPTNGGLVNPAADIGAIAKAHGITYLLDACQSIGQMPINVAAIGCDLLSATGRKYLRGPRGSGFLYCRQSLLDGGIEPPMVDHHASPWVEVGRSELRADARRFENWEFNYAAVLGLGAAIDYAQAIGGLEAIYLRIVALASALRAALAALPKVAIQDLGRPTSQCGLVTFTVEGFDSFDIKARLKEEASVELSVSGPSSTLIDATQRGLLPVVRASVHYYNNGDELRWFVVSLAKIIGAPVESKNVAALASI